MFQFSQRRLVKDRKRQAEIGFNEDKFRTLMIQRSSGMMRSIGFHVSLARTYDPSPVILASLLQSDYFCSKRHESFERVMSGNLAWEFIRRRETRGHSCVFRLLIVYD